MIGEYYHVTGITAIDVNNMNVAKYASREKPPDGKAGQRREEKRKYRDFQQEKEILMKTETEKRRKECSLQEHMQLMMWKGTIKNNILNQ